MFAKKKAEKTAQALASTRTGLSAITGCLQISDSDFQEAERTNEDNGKRLCDAEHFALCLLDTVRQAKQEQQRTGGYLKEGRDGIHCGLDIFQACKLTCKVICDALAKRKETMVRRS